MFLALKMSQDPVDGVLLLDASRVTFDRNRGHLGYMSQCELGTFAIVMIYEGWREMVR